MKAARQKLRMFSLKAQRVHIVVISEHVFASFFKSFGSASSLK
jgi:hypothetical protein